jgi:predicted regulator of Ras-like GTPase activity (Roadblock/LC7/MglB family)
MPTETLSVFEEDYWALHKMLRQLLEGSQARAVLLVDRGGQLVTCVGDVSGLDTTAFATLCAADFAATDQLAGLVGEREFSSLIHQGQHESIFAATLEESVILVVLFTSRTNLGLVRMKARQALGELGQVFRRIFAKAESETGGEDDVGPEFVHDAERELDRLFEGR